MKYYLGFKGFSDSSVLKNMPVNSGDTDWVPGLQRSPGEGNGNLHQYSCLGNTVDRGARQATVHGVEKSQTRLSNQKQEQLCI